MQIRPVLCIAGGLKADSKTPSISLTVTTKPAPQSKRAQDSGVKMDVKVRNSTVWLNVPLVERLHSFLNPVILRLASGATDRLFTQNSQTSSLMSLPWPDTSLVFTLTAHAFECNA